MALLTMWIFSTLTPHYDWDVIQGIEIIMPAAGSRDQKPASAVNPEAEVAPEVPPAPDPVETAEPTPSPAPPQEDRKRPAPENVSNQEPQPGGLKAPSKDVVVPSLRGDEQMQEVANNPSAQPADAAENQAPSTAEFREGIGEGVADGNALGDHGNWYMAQLYNKLSSTWAPPARGNSVGVQMAIVHFVIQLDGRISSLDVVDGNANSRFERSVRRCVMNASPLPPLPEDLGTGTIGITVPFRKQY